MAKLSEKIGYGMGDMSSSMFWKIFSYYLPIFYSDIFQLTLAQTMPVSGAIIVSTPQQVALADVVRGVELFRNEALNIPVLGFVENMAYFTPAELPQNKYYIFGKGGCRKLAEEMGIPLLGEIPLVQSIAESGDNGKPAALFNPAHTEDAVRDAFDALAQNTIAEICKLKIKN